MSPVEPAGIVAVILAGGPGTRILPLSLERPKALLPVANLPVLERTIMQLEEAGVARIILSVSPRARDTVLSWIGERSFRTEVTVPMKELAVGGSAGTVWGLAEELSDTTLVVYGDSLLKLEYRSLFEAHSANLNQGAGATLVYHRPPDIQEPEENGRTYHGVLSVEGNGRVSRFEEKPLVKHVGPGFNLANAAVFMLETWTFKHFPSRDRLDFSYDVFELLFPSEDIPMFGYDIGDGYRRDVGSLNRFLEINLQVLSGDLRAPIPGRHDDSGIWIGETSQVEECRILPPAAIGVGCELAVGSTVGPNTVLGNRVQLGAAACVSHSVILDGSSIGASAVVRDSIIGFNSILGDGVRIGPYSALGSNSVVNANTWPNWQAHRSKPV